ncbi:MAG TPA: helix-turn-helix domain-containing protein [Dongiaceae bacterium]|jgi:AraC-like DNA-binding protein|nr:helix-turn-helix domain-containing protein [Dongiaceae bacterium]
MNNVLNSFQPPHCKTADLPLRDRVPFWREVFARKIVQIDVEPDTDIPFEASATIQALPGASLLSPCHTTPATLRRTSRLVGDGDDSVAILANLDGLIVGSQRGREVNLSAGDATFILHAEPAEIRCSKTRYMSVLLPRKIAAGAIRDIESAAMRRIPADTEALRLLVSYVQMLPENLHDATPELGHAVATHIQDLFILALGPTRDAADRSKRRGLGAARLQAIKVDILHHLASESLSVTAVAKRTGITPRYIQLLFESEGMTFSAYVLDLRLRRAYRLLTDQRCAYPTIATIAYHSGFGDLSYFNRAFRRRYGASPSEIRARSH